MGTSVQFTNIPDLARHLALCYLSVKRDDSDCRDFFKILLNQTIHHVPMITYESAI